MDLPTELDPFKAAKAGLVFEGDVPAVAFLRIHGFNTLHYQLTCVMAEKEQPVLQLHLQADFELMCQRCNQTMPYALNEVITLDEDAPFEPMTLLEDELILALPMIPMHVEKDCSFFQNEAYYATKTENRTYKPFANLSKVKHSKE